MTSSDMTFVQVTPKIWLGSCPETIDDVERLKKECGITAVLNLQTDDDMSALDLNWSVINRQYVRSEIQLRRIPIIDFNSVDLCDHLPRAVQALKSLLSSGNTVYVHCTAGASRAPTIVVAYLTWCDNKDLPAAVKHVKALRVCSPESQTIEKASKNFRRS